MRKRRVLLTGGSGFIGRNVMESYLADRYEILAPRHSELELIDEVAVRDFIRGRGIEIVVHTAAKPGHRNAKDPSSVFYTNTRIFFNLARNADVFEKMIVTGSGAVYDGRFYQRKMSEDYYDAHVPVDEHGLSKYVLEKYIQASENIYDLRIFGIYGKYEDYTIRFISNMICKAMFDLPLTMNQNRMFDYLWVDDLMPVLEFVIENGLPFHSMNVTPDVSFALKDIAEIILFEMKKALPIVISKDGLGMEYSGDNSRMKSVLPNLQLTPLREGVRKLIHWYEANRSEVDLRSLGVNP